LGDLFFRGRTLICAPNPDLRPDQGRSASRNRGDVAGKTKNAIWAETQHGHVDRLALAASPHPGKSSRLRECRVRPERLSSDSARPFASGKTNGRAFQARFPALIGIL
jgi:hypothetical protein